MNEKKRKTATDNRAEYGNGIICRGLRFKFRKGNRQCREYAEIRNSPEHSHQGGQQALTGRSSVPLGVRDFSRSCLENRAFFA